MTLLLVVSGRHQQVLDCYKVNSIDMLDLPFLLSQYPLSPLRIGEMEL